MKALIIITAVSAAVVILTAIAILANIFVWVMRNMKE